MSTLKARATLALLNTEGQDNRGGRTRKAREDLRAWLAETRIIETRTIEDHVDWLERVARAAEADV